MRARSVVAAALALVAATTSAVADERAPLTFYEIIQPSLQGQPVSMAQYAGKVVLVVNTASECGFTPQYAQLEQLYNEYKDRGFVILGFPSNDFAGQEPGGNDEIATFCKKNYGVTFPMFAKITTKGARQAPIYRFISQTYGSPAWNFHKYLIDKRGRVKDYFAPMTKPTADRLKKAIDALLAE